MAAGRTAFSHPFVSVSFTRSNVSLHELCLFLRKFVIRRFVFSVANVRSVSSWRCPTGPRSPAPCTRDGPRALVCLVTEPCNSDLDSHLLWKKAPQLPVLPFLPPRGDSSGLGSQGRGRPRSRGPRRPRAEFPGHWQRPRLQHMASQVVPSSEMTTWGQWPGTVKAERNKLCCLCPF